MKTILLKSLATVVALGLPFGVFAQVSGTSSAGGSAGSAGTIPNTATPGSGAASSFGTDSAALFRQLDTDGDGKLSQQEFARISALLGSVTGVGGATGGGSGAGGATNGNGSNGGATNGNGSNGGATNGNGSNGGATNGNGASGGGAPGSNAR